MWTLAFEFSSDVRSVAIVRNDGTLRVAGHAVVKEVRRTPALALVDAALKEAGAGREQVERLVIGLGPGSYTGIRIALALVQGWQLATGIESVGLSSGDAMAEQEWRAGHRGLVHVIVDAQRGDLYHGVYGLDDGGWRVVEPLRIEPAEALVRDGSRWITPEAAPRLPWAESVFPDAGVLGEIASERGQVAPAAALEPIYLRAASFVKAPPPRIIPGLLEK